MLRLVHLIPLSVMAAFLFASAAAAQDGVPDQYATDPYYGAGQYAADPYAPGQSIPEQYGTDQYALDQGTPEQSTPEESAPEPVPVEGCGPDENQGGGDFQLVTITIKPSGVGDAPTYVAPGTTVRWVNGDTKPHTVTATDGSFDSGVLGQGESCSRTFDEPGEWKYRDRKDPGSKGSVIVRGTSGGGAATPEGSASDPAQPTDESTQSPA